MKTRLKTYISLTLMVGLLVTNGLLPRLQARTSRAAVAGPQSAPPLSEIVGKSYLEVLDLAVKIPVNPKDVEAYRAQLRREKEAKQAALKQEIEALKQQVEADKKKLDELNRRGSRDDAAAAQQRHDIHCDIQKIRKKLVQKEAIEGKTLDANYDNKEAKLDLLLRWPEEKRKIDAEVEAGKARQRPYGNVEDIGVRDVGKDQEKDIKAGEEASRELKALGLMPQEFKDEEVEKYIRNLTEYLAKNSDLRVPVKTTVLLTDEINAFALPGGFLYVNTGLILEADTESELAGVMAHEIAHAAARHSHRLGKKAAVRSILLQAAQIAAYVLTGGTVGLLGYYLLQYGFAGLGLLISLELLGVSREYEMEADQLGAQYMWKSGYDPKAFITFFDKMASKQGYARNTSFFRTHPAFADRIFQSFREFAFLPPRAEYMTDSTEFQQVRKRLSKLQKEALDKQKEEAKKKPRLQKEEPCPENDEPPQTKKP
jgi:hypothetical protein